MVVLMAFFGLAFLMLGMISEYLHRIYLETTGRPLYFIAKNAGFSTERVGATERVPAEELP